MLSYTHHAVLARIDHTARFTQYLISTYFLLAAGL